MMADRPPIYPSDFVPAPMDHVSGEDEFLRAIRLDAESERRLRAMVEGFSDERVASMVAGGYGPQDVADGRIN